MNADQIKTPEIPISLIEFSDQVISRLSKNDPSADILVQLNPILTQTPDLHHELIARCPDHLLPKLLGLFEARTSPPTPVSFFALNRSKDSSGWTSLSNAMAIKFFERVKKHPDQATDVFNALSNKSIIALLGKLNEWKHLIRYMPGATDFSDAQTNKTVRDFINQARILCDHIQSHRLTGCSPGSNEETLLRRSVARMMVGLIVTKNPSAHHLFIDLLSSLWTKKSIDPYARSLLVEAVIYGAHSVVEKMVDLIGPKRATEILMDKDIIVQAEYIGARMDHVLKNADRAEAYVKAKSTQKKLNTAVKNQTSSAEKKSKVTRKI